MPSIEIGDLYTKAQDDLKFNGDKAWETIKFCVTLSSTLITVTVGLLGAINYLAIDGVIKAFLIVALIPLIIMMKRLVDVTEKNFERECRRTYKNLAILMKIEDELPQRKDLSGNRNFKQETKYIPLEWEKNQFLTTEAYVTAMMQGKDKFYSNMRPIFPIFRRVSYVLLAIVSVIIIITVAPILQSFLKTILELVTCISYTT